MRRIKTFAELFEGESKSGIDWTAKGQELEKLCQDLNVIFEDYGYEFFYQPELISGVASSGNIILRDTVLVSGRTAPLYGSEKFPSNAIPGKNEGTKICLMREMLDAFIFKGQLEKTLDLLIINFVDDPYKSMPISDFHFSFGRDEGDAIIPKKYMNRVVAMEIPVNMSTDEFKIQFKDYIDSRITKVSKMYMADPKSIWIPAITCENIKLAEAIIRSVTDPKMFPPTKILDNMGEEELIEIIGGMSDWLYKRIDISGYLRRSNIDRSLIGRIEKTREDNLANQTKENLDAEERGLKIEQLASELNKKLFHYGINFIPDNEDPYLKGKKKGKHADFIEVFDDRLRGTDNYVWVNNIPGKWRIPTESSMLRRLILEIIFGYKDADNEDCKLNFFNESPNGGYYYLRNFKIEPKSSDEVKIVQRTKDSIVPTKIEFPIELPLGEIVDKIYNLILENLAQGNLYAGIISDSEEDIEEELKSLFDEEVTNRIKKDLIGYLYDLSPEIKDETKCLNEIFKRMGIEDILQSIGSIHQETLDKIDPRIFSDKGIDQEEIRLLRRMKKRSRYT